MFHVNHRHDEARAQRPDRPEPMGTWTAPAYLDKTREAAKVRTASALLVRKKGKNCMFSDLLVLPCMSEHTGRVLLPTLEPSEPGAEPTAQPLPGAVPMPSVPAVLGLPVPAG